VQRGYDVTRYRGQLLRRRRRQHACLVADALGMTKVLIHPFSSLLSPYGMGLAISAPPASQGIEEPFGEGALGSLVATGTRSAKRPDARWPAKAFPSGDIVVHMRAHIRLRRHDLALVCRR